MIDPDKYIVFKREDLERAAKDNGRFMEVFGPVWDQHIPDAVVIRRQDLFAGPALHNYASSIAVALRFVNGDEVTRRRLQELSDFFHQQGVLADEEAFKVPD